MWDVPVDALSNASNEGTIGDKFCAKKDHWVTHPKKGVINANCKTFQNLMTLLNNLDLETEK